MTKNVIARDPRKIANAAAIAHQSTVFNGFATYHVRFFFFPKPRKSMALLISSILSSVEKIRGTQIFITFFTLVPSFSFLDKSSPLLCCASAISW